MRLLVGCRRIRWRRGDRSIARSRCCCAIVVIMLIPIIDDEDEDAGDDDGDYSYAFHILCAFAPRPSLRFTMSLLTYDDALSGNKNGS